MEPTQRPQQSASRVCNGLGPPLLRQLQARPSAGRRDKVIEPTPSVQCDQLAGTPPSYRRPHKNAMVDGRPLERRAIGMYVELISIQRSFVGATQLGRPR